MPWVKISRRSLFSWQSQSLSIRVSVLSHGKPTSQSTFGDIFGVSLSSYGVDGDRSTCSSTKNDVSRGWWMVDLSKKSIVVAVAILQVPRVSTDSSQHLSQAQNRLSTHQQSKIFKVMLSGGLTDFNIRVGSQRANHSNPLCFEHARIVAEYELTTKCKSSVRGRYLYIETNLPSAAITVCEVKVYGYHLGPP